VIIEHALIKVARYIDASQTLPPFGIEYNTAAEQGASIRSVKAQSSPLGPMGNDLKRLKLRSPVASTARISMQNGRFRYRRVESVSDSRKRSTEPTKETMPVGIKITIHKNRVEPPEEQYWPPEEHSRSQCRCMFHHHQQFLDKY